MTTDAWKALKAERLDYYKSGLQGVMRPPRGTLADAAWRAGRDNAKERTDEH